MIYIYRVYQWLIAIPLLLILTLLTCLVTAAHTLLAGHRSGAYWAPMVWSRCVCALCLIRVKVRGRKNIDRKQSYVFVANHQGAFDIWAIYGYLGQPFKWLMKKSLEKVPFVGATCRYAGHVFVDDSSIQGIKDTINNAQHTLKEGMSVVIFPEGSRTYDGHMIPFKRGAFMLAAEFKLPVVPITIDGAFKAMPRNTRNITPCTITLSIHQPRYPGENGFNTKRLMADCRTAINSALPPEHKDAT